MAHNQGLEIHQQEKLCNLFQQRTCNESKQINKLLSHKEMHIEILYTRLVHDKL